MSYSLDINFLKDKPGYLEETKKRDKGKGNAAPTNTAPILLGLVVGLALAGGALGAKLYFDQANNQLRQDTAGLDAELEKVKQEEAKVTAIDAETKAIQDQTASIANVFDQVKPWSAVLKDLSDRAPSGLQIDNVRKVEIAPTPPDPGAPPPATPPGPRPGVEISGSARTFNDVNDFLILLQKSSLFNDKDTVLMSSTTQPNSVQVTTGNGTNVSVKLPDVVKYQIRAPFSDVPASEILAELERKGAIGLVERIETLKAKGVI